MTTTERRNNKNKKINYIVPIFTINLFSEIANDTPPRPTEGAIGVGAGFGRGARASTECAPSAQPPRLIDWESIHLQQLATNAGCARATVLWWTLKANWQKGEDITRHNHYMDKKGADYSLIKLKRAGRTMCTFMKIHMAS